MPTVRTTLRPDEEITVSDAEYEQLLEDGLIYDGTPPVEGVDPLDQRMADRINNPTGPSRGAWDALYVSAAKLVLSPTAPSSPAPGTVWINTTTP